MTRSTKERDFGSNYPVIHIKINKGYRDVWTNNYKSVYLLKFTITLRTTSFWSETKALPSLQVRDGKRELEPLRTVCKSFPSIRVVCLGAYHFPFIGAVVFSWQVRVVQQCHQLVFPRCWKPATRWESQRGGESFETAASHHEERRQQCCE